MVYSLLWDCFFLLQEPLSSAVANQICEEFKDYSDICDTLDKLEITISFLKSVKEDPNMPLEIFVTQTLKMENPLPTHKVILYTLQRMS